MWGETIRLSTAAVTPWGKAIRSEKDKAHEKAMKAMTVQLAKDERRIAELDTIISKLCE